MDQQQLLQLANQLVAGQLTAEQFAHSLAPRLAELSTATLDLDRRSRCGYPEVVFAEGKTVEQLTEIIAELLSAHQDLLVTRIEAGQVTALGDLVAGAIHNPIARTLRQNADGGNRSVADDDATTARVSIITAGSADQPVAEEASETLLWMGVTVNWVHDVGVAGPHRLPAKAARFAGSDAIVVVAGMEGALPSVVGGYVACPVIAVPTSVGYGANLGGISALLSMLNSCASNVAVVNIDAGFKAGYMAGLIAKRMEHTRRSVREIAE